MNYQFDSFVNRHEAEALKELIFKRARERANSMTDDVQSDIMNIARESFVNNKNPFSQLIQQNEDSSAAVTQSVKQEQPSVKTSALHEYVEAAEAAADGENEEVGFPVKDYTGIIKQNTMIREQMTTAQLQNTMIEAREGLSNKKSFMGALSFLNSQAAASLLNKRAGKGIDVVA